MPSTESYTFEKSTKVIIVSVLQQIPNIVFRLYICSAHDWPFLKFIWYSLMKKCVCCTWFKEIFQVTGKRNRPLYFGSTLLPLLHKVWISAQFQFCRIDPVSQISVKSIWILVMKSSLPIFLNSVIMLSPPGTLLSLIDWVILLVPELLKAMNLGLHRL